jgi:hypothetical protein
VTGHPVLRKIAACTATANLFGSMSGALGIVFLVRVLHVRPAETGARLVLFPIAYAGLTFIAMVYNIAQLGAIGIRPTIWVGVVGGWTAALWVVFSPLRTTRDIPEQAIQSPPAAEGAGLPATA